MVKIDQDFYATVYRDLAKIYQDFKLQIFKIWSELIKILCNN